MADEGAPRKTSNYKRFSGMASQNERYNVKDDEMFWLENIMRVGPRKLRSVPGPGKPIKIAPPAPPTICVPDPQNLVEFDVYDLDSNLTSPPPGGTGWRVTWGFVESDTTIVAMRENPVFVGFGNPRYNNDTYVKVFRAQHGVAPEIAKTHGSGIADNTTPADGEVMVHSDQPSYGFYQFSGFYYFDWTNNIVVQCARPATYFPFKVNAACKNGSDIYLVVNHGTFGGDHVGQLVHFSYPAGTFIADSTVLTGYSRTVALDCSANFLYALSTDGTGFYFIDKIDRTALTIADHYVLGQQFIASMSVVDDTLIYFDRYAVSKQVDIYYWHLGSIVHLNTGGPISISVGIPIVPGLGAQDTRYNFIFRAPYFYFGENGFGGFPVSITKIGPVIC